MDQGFFAYLELLEMLVFFSGYPLVYLLVLSMTDNTWIQKYLGKDVKHRMPTAYALVALLYLGLQLKNLYPDYSVERLSSNYSYLFLQIWALLALLFFVPSIARKPVLSLVHSLVFFYFIVKDMVLFVAGGIPFDSLKNDMNIYTYSLALNMAAFFFILILHAGYKKITGK